MEYSYEKDSAAMKNKLSSQCYIEIIWFKHYNHSKKNRTFYNNPNKNGVFLSCSTGDKTGHQTAEEASQCQWEPGWALCSGHSDPDTRPASAHSTHSSAALSTHSFPGRHTTLNIQPASHFLKIPELWLAQGRSPQLKGKAIFSGNIWRHFGLLKPERVTGMWWVEAWDAANFNRVVSRLRNSG